MIQGSEFRKLLSIVLDENVFPDDWEFETLFGVSRSELVGLESSLTFEREKLSRDERHFSQLFVSQLLGYPHQQNDYIRDKYNLDLTEERVLEHLRLVE